MYSDTIMPLHCEELCTRNDSCSPGMGRVPNGNTNCKEHRHRLWSRTFPEQKSGKNYPKEAAEHISPDPEQSTSIWQHGILTATFWDGSMYLHCIVTKITAIKSTQWMLELALHRWAHSSTLLLCPRCRALLLSWWPTLHLPVQAVSSLETQPTRDRIHPLAPSVGRSF